MTRRVLLHVGTPKTGTSYFQDVLFSNRPLLAAHGVHYFADRFDAHFLAALDLMRLPWGGLEIEAVGAWDALAERVRGVPDGTVVISHEIFARATRQQAQRALADLGDSEVHVLVSARDLARQVPAEWQENIKHRSTFSYAQFLRIIQSPERRHRVGSWFWGVQELPDILDRWAGGLPPEQVHVVTVPPRGSEPTLLWKRFVQAFGLEGIDLDLSHASRANPSLGVPETALVRRINKAVNETVPPADYRPLVRELLAHGTLSRRRGTPRLGLPPDVAPWVEDLSRRWVGELDARGYAVVGDLGELIGRPPTEYVDPDRPRPRQVAGAAVDAIHTLLLEAARLQHDNERLRGELDETRRELDRAYLRVSYKIRRRFVLLMERTPPGRLLMRAYRWVFRR